MKDIIAVAVVMILGMLVVTLFSVMSGPTIATATQYLEERGYEVIPATFATDITDIKAKTDLLPFSPASEATSALIKAKTDLIPIGTATQSSLASMNITLEEIAYEVEVIDTHSHGEARWFGSPTVAGNTTSVATPSIATSLFPFKIISNTTVNTFGPAIIVMAGTENFNTYRITDNTTYYNPQKYMDGHTLFVTDVGHSGRWRLRFISSETFGGVATFANAASAEAAGAYTDVVFKIDSTSADSCVIPMQVPRTPLGSTIWARVMDSNGGGDDAGRTCYFMYGLHLYEE
jgi:hypothetical protein